MRKRFDFQLFETDTSVIDRTGAATLIPEEKAREIIQGVVTQSAVLQRGRKLANMASKTYKMPVLDMLPLAYFVNGDSGQKKTTKMAWDKKFITAEEIAGNRPDSRSGFGRFRVRHLGRGKTKSSGSFWKSN